MHEDVVYSVRQEAIMFDDVDKSKKLINIIFGYNYKRLYIHLYYY